ncbi:MAG: glutathione ABC transporter substrate-binding protein [Limnochordales bacterium]|nr:glutathione ABC transporter substrate-binding protein [Limnochordales bacterium]
MPNNAAQRIPHIFLALLLALAWAAPPVQAATVVVANPGEPPTLDANMTFNGFSFLVTNQILETLVYKDEAGFQPRLATAWEAVDERTWRLKLREGVTFHDGTPFDAHAVKFTIERILDPANRAQGRFVVSMIEEVRVIDAHTVELVTSSPFAPLLAHLTHPMTAIVSPAAVERLGEDFGRHPVGTGPFVFESWQAGDQVILRRNEHYWGGAPAIETVIIRTIPEPATQVVELRSGAVDFIFNVSPDHMNDLSSRPGIAVRKELGWGSTLLGFNVTQGPLADVRVRRAIAHALNTDAMATQLRQGLAVPATTGLVPETVWGAAEVGRYPYDPAEARRLLAEAGYPNGFRTSLLAFESPELRQIAEAIQFLLGEVGIQVEVQILEYGAYSALVTEPDREGMFLTTWGTVTLDSDYTLYALLHSSQIPDNNFSFYRNEEVDRLLDEARRNADEAFRLEAYRRVAEIVQEELPIMALYYPLFSYAKNARVEGEVINYSWINLNLADAVVK